MANNTPTVAPDDEVRQVLSAASNYEPGDIWGTWLLGDPPPLGLDGPTIDAVRDALNVYLDANGGKEIQPGEISGKLRVIDLIHLVQKKLGP